MDAAGEVEFRYEQMALCIERQTVWRGDDARPPFRGLCSVRVDLIGDRVLAEHGRHMSRLVEEL